MEDADEAVGECPYSSVMGVAVLSALVIEGAGSGASYERGECPEVAGVGESSVPNVAGEDDASGAGCVGDWRGACILFGDLALASRFGSSPNSASTLAPKIIARPGKDQMIFASGCFSKMVRQLGFKAADLGLQFADHADQRGDAGAHCFGHDCGGLQLFRTQRRLNLTAN